MKLLQRLRTLHLSTKVLAFLAVMTVASLAGVPVPVAVKMGTAISEMVPADVSLEAGN